MLIVALLKGVPARTTKVVSVGGIMKREEMEIVLNPHDAKAIEAADFVRRRVGGKIVALSMGPDVKLSPLIKPLYRAEVLGVDEAFILSDRKMAGADTLATSYAIALGVSKLLERHTRPLDELAGMVEGSSSAEAVLARARELYAQNLVPNSVCSDLPSVGDGTIVQRLAAGALPRSEAAALLRAVSKDLSRFLILTGIKTTDGETGSVGPQVAECLAESMSLDVPHLTYVDDFDVDPGSSVVRARRRFGRLLQRVELQCPAVLTIAPEYEPRGPDPRGQVAVRANCFRGKVYAPTRWTADDLGADPARLGIPGSPTIVGPGMDVGRLPTQKVIGRTSVFAKRSERLQIGSTALGPFERGDSAESVPEPLLAELKSKGMVVPFTFEMFREELFAE
ncbi:MAG: hypothetical protein ABSF83_13565 [Nitrososphaerales archaeon]|jgi:electron transfer flavoprotein beta subunit